jgi:hypothetical protein
MTQSTLPEGTPILCRHCGGHARMLADASLECPYCGTRDALPADELGRALEIQSRLRAAEQRAAHVRGFENALAGVFEDPRAFLRVSGLYVAVASLVLGASMVNMVLTVLPNLEHLSLAEVAGLLLAQALAPFGLLAVAGTFGAALLTGRIHYRRRIRPLLLARPPAQAGAPFACRACGGALPAARSGSTSCIYCHATNLVPEALHGRLAADLAREAESAQKQLFQANIATMSIAGAMRRTAVGCGLLCALAGGVLLVLVRLLQG